MPSPRSSGIAAQASAWKPAASPVAAPGLDAVYTLYPIPPVLKNTFLEYTDLRSPSLDEYLKVRECSSCPATRQGSLETPRELPGEPCYCLHAVSETSSAKGELADATWAPGPAPCGELAPDARWAGRSPQVPPAPAPVLTPTAGVQEPPQEDACVLKLAEWLSTMGDGQMPLLAPAPETWPRDPAALPSVGSVGHHLGQCKPCVFIEKGCTNGQVCQSWAPGLAPYGELAPDARWAARPPYVPPAPAPSLQEDASVLKLAEWLSTMGDGQMPPLAPAPDMGPRDLAALPSVGSVGHHLGQCKPCVFIEKGCTNGQACQFCHLCDASVLRQLKREKTRWRKLCRGERWNPSRDLQAASGEGHDLAGARKPWAAGAAA